MKVISVAVNAIRPARSPSPTSYAAMRPVAVLVAATEMGACAIMLGDDAQALSGELQGRFLRAELIGGDAGFERTVARVVDLIDAPAQRLDLPLDIRGTAFQQRVWAASRQDGDR